MGFFDTEKGVEQYIKMAEGYDGAELITILEKYLPENSTVLATTKCGLSKKSKTFESCRIIIFQNWTSLKSI